MNEERAARKSLCEQCIDISSAVILGLCKKISDRAAGAELDKRRFLLIGFAVRSVNSGAAIRRLWADRPFAEDMGILLRPLVETVINAVYLQYSPEIEVDAFISFDTVSLAKTMNLADQIIPSDQPGISPAMRIPFEALAETKRKEFEGVSSSTSWTKLDLHSRAVAVDKATGLSLCGFLSRIVYRHGHTYIHATYRSLESTLDALRTGTYDAEFTESEAEHNLFASAQTLHVCAMLIQHVTNFLDHADLLSASNELLKRYSDSISLSA